MKRRPPIDIDLFKQAETHLETEFISPAEAELLTAFRAALADRRFAQALELLVQLGDLQRCGRAYWRVLEQLAGEVWPTRCMVDRRAKGQRETRIAHIQQRASGQAEPGDVP